MNNLNFMDNTNTIPKNITNQRPPVTKSSEDEPSSLFRNDNKGDEQEPQLPKNIQGDYYRLPVVHRELIENNDNNDNEYPTPYEVINQSNEWMHILTRCAPVDINLDSKNINRTDFAAIELCPTPDLYDLISLNMFIKTAEALYPIFKDANEDAILDFCNKCNPLGASSIFKVFVTKVAYKMLKSDLGQFNGNFPNGWRNNFLKNLGNVIVPVAVETYQKWLNITPLKTLIRDLIAIFIYVRKNNLPVPHNILDQTNFTMRRSTGNGNITVKILKLYTAPSLVVIIWGLTEPEHSKFPWLASKFSKQLLDYLGGNVDEKTLNETVSAVEDRVNNKIKKDGPQKPFDWIPYLLKECNLI